MLRGFQSPLAGKWDFHGNTLSRVTAVLYIITAPFTLGAAYKHVLVAHLTNKSFLP